MHRAAKQTVSLFLVALVAVGLTACDRTGSGATGSNADPSVAATVNGRNIPLSEVETLLSQQAKSQEVQVTQMSPLELASGRLQILDDLIKQEVLFQRAEKEKLLPTEDEITQAINQQKFQSGLTEEAYQKMLKESGQTEPALRELARKQLALKKLTDKMITKITAPSDKEVEDFYNNNKQRYINARGVGLAAIVVDPSDNGLTDDAKSDADAKSKIDIISQRLKSNADFATVAREKSEDSSRLRGGDIGFFTEDQLKQAGFPADLIAKFFGPMQVGDITAPVATANGRLSVFKLTQKRLQSENLTLDNPDVRKDITDNIVNQRGQILNSALLEVAMNEAQIVNNLAVKMLNNPENLSGLRPAQPAGTATPAASPAGQASPQASGSPATGTSTTPSSGAQASPSPKS